MKVLCLPLIESCIGVPVIAHLCTECKHDVISDALQLILSTV